MTLDAFHRLLGETIMYCQFIEHDVKRIYAAMHTGDFYENLDEIEKWSLGQTVKNLQLLDCTVPVPYISPEDYRFLMQMSGKRNHWCHETYQRFCYTAAFLESEEYAAECRRLQRDNDRLLAVYEVLENVRIQALKDFGRKA